MIKVSKRLLKMMLYLLSFASCKIGMMAKMWPVLKKDDIFLVNNFKPLFKFSKLYKEFRKPCTGTYDVMVYCTSSVHTSRVDMLNTDIQNAFDQADNIFIGEKLNPVFK